MRARRPPRWRRGARSISWDSPREPPWIAPSTSCANAKWTMGSSASDRSSGGSVPARRERGGRGPAGGGRGGRVPPPPVPGLEGPADQVYLRDQSLAAAAQSDHPLQGG